MTVYKEKAVTIQQAKAVHRHGGVWRSTLDILALGKLRGQRHKEPELEDSLGCISSFKSTWAIQPNLVSINTLNSKVESWGLEMSQRVLAVQAWQPELNPCRSS